MFLCLKFSYFFGGDIWSENCVVIFAVIVHFIDAEWKLHNRLVVCKGLHNIAHTGVNLVVITYKGLFEAGVGPDINTIHEDLHVCTPDEGSNMLNVCVEIEGMGCVCHREQNCLGTALSLPCYQPVIKKIKAACAHFHRSNKVNGRVYPCPFCICCHIASIQYIIYIYIYVCVCVCIYVYIYICICICIYMVYIYICVYMYMYMLHI